MVSREERFLKKKSKVLKLGLKSQTLIFQESTKIVGEIGNESEKVLTAQEQVNKIKFKRKRR